MPNVLCKFLSSFNYCYNWITGHVYNYGDKKPNLESVKTVDVSEVDNSRIRSRILSFINS